jgi:hypothetical protein
MASKEMDSDKLLELVAKINCVLDEHNKRSTSGKIEVETIILPRTGNTADENRYSW